MLIVLTAAVLLLPATVDAASWEDPLEDHEVGYTAGSQFEDDSYVWSPGEQTGWYPYVDLVGASVEEPTDDTIRFGVDVVSTDAEGSEPQEVDALRFEFLFTYHGENRSVLLTHIVSSGETVASLRTLDGDRWRVDFTVEAVQAEDGWYVDIPKFQFRDARLVPLRAGDVLEDVRVHSWTVLWSTYSPCLMRPETPPRCWKARDAVQDATVLGDYEVVRSPPNVGHLELTAAEPLRSSNGLATTYIFELTLYNLEPEADRVLMAVDRVPDDWQMNMPLVVEVAGDSSVRIPVAASVPFTHLHGQENYVNVTATSQRDPEVEATQTIGVVWTQTPQPAGHHPVLYLHGVGGSAWMNTLAEDPDGEPDARTTAQSTSINFGLDEAAYSFTFRVPLDPPLQSGLDFDLNRPMGAIVALDFPVEVEPTVAVRLLIHNQTDVTTIIGSAEYPASPTNGVEVYELAPAVNPEADRVPYGRDSNLRLEVTVNFTQEGGGFLPGDEENPAPRLVPAESEIHLPLVEFVELPDEALLSSLTKFALSARTETEKRVNPGETAAFGFVVENNGEERETIDWKLFGSNTAWATVHPRASNVPAGGNATVAVTIVPPEHAVEGEHAQILLFGQSRDDPNAQVFVQVLAQVTTVEDLESEDDLARSLRGEADAGDAQRVPVPWIVPFIALVASLWLARRQGA